ncbi:MAG: hypothetical protein H0X12_04965 [Nocardioides sp.]|nr:hypothetical protein [Nocardioides sp.]
MLPRAASEFYAAQQRVSATTLNEVGRLWSRMGDDLDASWRRIGPPVLQVITEGQLVMAESAAEYVPALLSEVDIKDRPAADLVPESLVGFASDGRRLDTLANQALISTKVDIASGATIEQALDGQGKWLQLVSQLQVADTARQAVGIGTATRPNVGGHVRVLNAPSCQRCAVLGGRFYRWSTGFDRHPRCDCTMAPCPSAEYAKAEGFLGDPMAAYRNGEIRDLTAAQRSALNNGADISQVVNVRRGMSMLGLTTREGVSRRGVAGKRLGNFARQPGVRYSMSQTPRFTPEAIYRLATDRAEAISMLRRYGYIT